MKIFDIKNRYSGFLLCMLIFCCSAEAQMYEEAKKAKVKPAKAPVEVDTSIKYLKTGIVLAVQLGFNRGTRSGEYYYYQDGYINANYYYPEVSGTYEMKNAFGYLFSIVPGIHGRSYGFELPLTLNVNRFKVPELGTDRLKCFEVQMSMLNYFKFGKEKNNIQLGHSFGFGQSFNAYLVMGYGREIIKNLTANLRYNLNPEALIFGPYVDVYKYGSDFEKAWAFSSLQLVFKYDLVSTRKMGSPKLKRVKEPKPRRMDDGYSPAPSRTRVQDRQTEAEPERIDYSRKSDEDLKDLLKEANANNDLDAMLAIQKEIDSRKSNSELQNLSDKELDARLKKALDEENYKEAEIIKKEIQKRKTGVAPTKTSGGLQGKTIPQLKKLLEEALAKEDYKTAKEIQDIIKEKEGK